MNILSSLRAVVAKAMADPANIAELSADTNAKPAEILALLTALDAILKRTPKKRPGAPKLPPEPNLADDDKEILRLAREYTATTGKKAANGARGRKITNQGGPFVKFAAERLGKPHNSIMNRLDRFERHPRLRTLWDSYRTPAKIRYAAYLKGAGLAD